MRRLLWATQHRPRSLPPPPHPGRVSLPLTDQIRPAYFDAIGFRAFKIIALRIDILERLASRIWTLSHKGPFELPTDIQTMAGCHFEAISEILQSLGYRHIKEDGKILFRRTPRLYRTAKRSHNRKQSKRNHQSPFAKLNNLKTKR